jgi:hypothetical protein
VYSASKGAALPIFIFIPAGRRFLFVCQQQHVTVFEKSVETDVMPSLFFVQRCCGSTFYVPRQQSSKRLENCKNEYQISLLLKG